MREWTIGRRIAAGFGAVLCLVLGFGLFIELERSGIASQARSLDADSLPGLYLSGRLEAMARTNYALTLEYVHAATLQEKTRIEGEMRALGSRIDQVAADYEKRAVLPEDWQLYEAMIARRAEFLRLREAEVLAPGRRSDAKRASAESKRAAAALARTVRPAFDQFMSATDAVVAVNHAHANAGAEAIGTFVERAQLGLMVGFCLVVIVGASVGYVIATSSSRVLDAAASDLGAGRPPGGRRVAAGGLSVTGAVRGSDRAGGVARGDVGLDGGDGVDDPAQRRELAAGRDPDGRSRPAGAVVECGARADGHFDDLDPGVQHQGREDHQDDRRDRLPDQHPRPQRRRRGGPRGRGRDGLRGRRRRGAQPGAALGPGRPRHRRPDRGVVGEGRGGDARTWSTSSPPSRPSPAACRG